MVGGFQWFFLVIFLALYSTTADVPVTRCPGQDVIFPCTCKYGPWPGDLSTFLCTGPNVTQPDIDNLTKEIHLVYPNETNLIVHRFDITNTNLTSLDLNSLVNISMKISLYITKNPSLSKIIDPLPHVIGKIKVPSLSLTGTNLTDAGFGNALKYFSPEILEGITLNENRLSGSFAGEFIPGLSSFTRLYGLNFDQNQIKRIGAQQFKLNSNLEQLSFFKNQIEEIAEDAFKFDAPTQHVDQLRIILDMNPLAQDKMHVNSGISQLVVRSRLELSFMNLTTLPSNLFESFLRANNTISVYRNPLICDERVKWLKDAKDVLQNYVQNANCANDPGHTVFTSSLIP